jgi:hypothetical protein
MDHEMYRAYHPKIPYDSARKAATALNEMKRQNKGTCYERSNYRLVVYFDGDDNCYHIGHDHR